MSFAKVILPVLALSGLAFAQSNSTGCSGSLTIKTQSDAGQLENCQTWDGDITIDPSASGQISLNGVQQITGDLTCNNATQLTALSSDQIGSIGGTFSLMSLTIMSSLQFNSLSGVNHINWVGLPAIQQLTFNQGISKANTVYISDTTLTSLTGITLTAVGSIDINNNPYLTDVDVNDLTNVTSAASFSANGYSTGQYLSISFPNLQTAGNLTFLNVSGVSMPSLASVPGSMGFYSDYFSNFSAPNLTSIGNSLAFVDSANLASLEFPMLKTIGGGFLIANNTALQAIDGFPLLSKIGGAIDFAGEFNNVTLHSLQTVLGGSNVQTTSTNTAICTLFNQAHSAGVIRGTNTCETGKSNPDTNPSATGSGSSASATASKGAAASLFDPSAPLTGLSAIIAAILFI